MLRTTPVRRADFAVALLALASLAFSLSATPALRAQQSVPPAAGQTSPPPGPARGAARGGGFAQPEPLDYNDHEGWTAIFDGRTLQGWDGNPDVWRVEDGAITASSTAERRVGSTHLIWTGGELGDFEMKLEMKLDGDIHSGIAYRSSVDVNRGSSAPGAGRGGNAPVAGARSSTSGATGTPAPPAGGATAPARGPANPPAVPANPKWTLYGPGMDFDADLTMAGNVEDRGTARRELAWRGGIVKAEAGKRPRVIGSLGDADTLKGFVKAGDWNQIHIVARGNQVTHIINGHVMTMLIDEDPEFYKAKGLIGVQIEQFGAGRVNFRNIWIKK